MLIQHNLENVERMSQGCGDRHGEIYASFDLPIVGVKTYVWDIYGESIEDIRCHTRDVKFWAHQKAHNAGDVPYRVEVL